MHKRWLLFLSHCWDNYKQLQANISILPIHASPAGAISSLHSVTSQVSQCGTTMPQPTVLRRQRRSLCFSCNSLQKQPQRGQDIAVQNLQTFEDRVLCEGKVYITV